MRYSFADLSDIDFEELVGDLLQKELRLRLSFHSKGRDQGIDLRFGKAARADIIVQAKHYSGSSFSALLSSLKKEVPKVRQLDPGRYMIATSLPLTPLRKRQVASLFGRYCKSPDDVLGRDDLNALLRKFSSVHKRHFKLWLPGVDILEALLYADALNRSRFIEADIRRRVRLYVRTSAHAKAIKLLKKNRYCVISGPPGIGKTMMAEVLAAEYVRKGYRLVAMRRDLSEGWRRMTPGRKVLFLYDDFLGRAALAEKATDSDDSELVRFMRAAALDPMKRVVLTTREYILREAKRLSERLAQSTIEGSKYILELRDYTLQDRARILYNHLYFGKMSNSHIAELVDSRAYLKIVQHENFSPRIVEFMCDPKRLAGVQASNYSRTFLDRLANPSDIWSHAFNEQISSDARTVLLIVATMPHPCELASVESCFQRAQIVEGQPATSFSSADTFERAVDLLDGTFIRTIASEETIFVEEVNPSVQDYLTKKLSSQPSLAAALVGSAIFFEQFWWLLWRAEKVDGRSAIVEHARRDGLTVQHVQRIWRSERCTVVRSTSTFYRARWNSVSDKVALLVQLALDQSVAAGVRPAIHEALNELVSLDCGAAGGESGMCGIVGSLKKGQFAIGPTIHGLRDWFVSNQLPELDTAHDFSTRATLLSYFPPELVTEQLQTAANKFGEYLKSTLHLDCEECDSADELESIRNSTLVAGVFLNVSTVEAQLLLSSQSERFVFDEIRGSDPTVGKGLPTIDKRPDEEVIGGWFDSLLHYRPTQT